MKNLKVFSLLLLLTQSGFFGAYGQNWDKIIKIAADDRENFGSFGYSVSVSGNYAAIGSIGATKDANNSNSLTSAGAVYILHNDGVSWKQVKKLYPPQRSAYDYFGSSVSISGNYVIVGAYQETEDSEEKNTISGSGSAYIFEKDQGGQNAWGLAKKITAPARKKNAFFGRSVAINGDYAIVGAYMDNASSDNALYDSGAAYVFKRDQQGDWGLFKTLTASDRYPSDNFGYAVAMSENYAIVSATNEYDESGSVYMLGAAYIFKKDENSIEPWKEIRKVIAPVRASSDGFGQSVAISDEFAVVGAPYEDENTAETEYLFNSGSVYIFKNNSGAPESWSLAQKITAGVRHTGDAFGGSVAINGNYVVTGAINEDLDSDDANYIETSGSAYIFMKNGVSGEWSQVKKITASLRSNNANFGKAVSIDGQNILVGANLENNDALEANTLLYPGAIYFYSSSGVLPVTLTSFSASKEENQALLTWQTERESQSDYFEIQRSGDGKHWESLARVTAATESTSAKNYSYVDSAPRENTNYYRLKMFDMDKTFTYSRIRTVAFSDLRIGAFYPNPVVDRLYLPTDRADKVVLIDVLNNAGKVVLQSRQAENGLSVKSLHAGSYLLRVTYGNGETTHSKMIIQK